MLNIEVQHFMQAVVELLDSACIEMMDHRDDEYPYEAVGILCSDGTVFRLINQARSRSRFEVSEVLSTEALELLANRNKLPIAIYHSHPESSASPSNRDILMMQTQHGALSIIIGVDSISAWVWDDDGLQSVGRIPLPERTRIVESA